MKLEFIRITVIYASLVVSAAAIYPAEGYRGIVPLHSNCEDVKRILGVKACETPDTIYELKDEVVRISYSQRSCDKAWDQTWNVPLGTVMGIERRLRVPLPLSDLSVDLSKYEKMIPQSDIGEIFYSSKEDGLEFLVVNNSVRSIFHAPTPKDKYLLCSCEGQQK